MNDAGKLSALCKSLFLYSEGGKAKLGHADLTSKHFICRSNTLEIVDI